MRILYHSYLGYQCYADTDPESHWKLNHGGGVMVHFDRLAVGVRLTGKSKTAILLALHDIIQVTVGWTDSHLFEFVVGERVYSEPLPDDEFFERKVCNAAGIRLRTLIGRGVERLLYVYDFGDDWRHDVIIEDVRDGAPDIDYPAFVAGERRCPPEDVGGVPGFMLFLEAALNPFHDEHEEVLTWYGKPFDRDDIDERYVRMALTTIANRRRGALMRHRASARRLHT